MFEKLAEKLIDLGHDAGITFVQDNIKDALSKSKRSIVGTLIAPHIFETMTLL